MRENIPVSVVVCVPFQGFAEQGEMNHAFVVELQWLLDELVADLRIPAGVSVSVLAEAAVNAKQALARVVIGGVDCRLPAGQPLAPNVDACEFARYVMRIVHRHRGLFVTSTMAAALRLEFAAALRHLGQLPVKTFHQVLVMLADGAFRIDRIRDLPISESADVMRAEDAFDQVIRSASTTQVAVEFGSPAASGDTSPDEMFALIQDGLFYELGLRVPRIACRVDPILRDVEFRIRINDVRVVPVAGLKANEFLVNDTPDRLKLLGVDAIPTTNPANGKPCAVAQDVDGALKKCETALLTTWTPHAYAGLVTTAEIREHAAWLVTADIVDFDLQLLQREFPDLVAAARERFGLIKLTQIIRRLMAEQISARNLRGVLESLLAIAGTTRATFARAIVFLPSTDHVLPTARDIGDLKVDDYAEAVRLTFKRQISHRYTRGGSSLAVYLMSPEAESRIATSDEHPLSTEEHAELVNAVFHAVGQPAASQNPVILTSIAARRALKRELALELPALSVLSYQELPQDFKIVELPRIDYTPALHPAASDPLRARGTG